MKNKFFTPRYVAFAVNDGNFTFGETSHDYDKLRKLLLSQKPW